jgi:hypothetical protein
LLEKDTMLEKMKKEQGWIYLSLKINLLIYATKFKNKQNGFYRSLSSGGNKLLGVTNFEWFRQSFDHGFYRCSIMGNFISINFFLKISDLNKYNSVVRQLNIRARKLGGFSLNLSDMNSIDYADKILLSSKNGNCLNAYQKILKTYSGPRS